MPTRDSLHIMIIDDDREDRELFVSTLSEFDLNFICTPVENGSTALDLLMNENWPCPDIIFLDLRMPKVSGKNVLIRLKGDELCADTPVVIMTTSTDPEEARQLKELGAIHFCSKPSDPEELYFVISMALEEALPAQ